MAEIGYCQAAIISLVNASPEYNPLASAAGTLRALTDQDSARRLNEMLGANGNHVLNGDGNPTLTVKYYTNDSAASLTEPTCNDTVRAQPQSVEVVMDMYRQRPGVAFPLEDLQQLCGDAAAIDTSPNSPLRAIPNTPVMNEVAAVLYPQIRKLVQDVNLDVETELITRVGFNSRMAIPDATAQNVNLFNATTGEKRIDGWATVDQDLRYNEMDGSPIVLGGGMINRYARALEWGCCNDGGTDYQRVLNSGLPRFYFDPTADTVFGADDFLVIAPTAAMALSRSRYMLNGKSIMKSGTSEYGTFELPEFPGFVFDIIATSEGCTTPGTNFIISASFGLYTAPARYGAGDRLNGVNGIVRYNGVAV